MTSKMRQSSSKLVKISKDKGTNWGFRVSSHWPALTALMWPTIDCVFLGLWSWRSKKKERHIWRNSQTWWSYGTRTSRRNWNIYRSTRRSITSRPTMRKRWRKCCSFMSAKHSTMSSPIPFWDCRETQSSLGRALSPSIKPIMQSNTITKSIEIWLFAKVQYLS